MIYVLHMNTRGDNGGIILIHLTCVLALNSRIPEVDARSRLCFSDRNLGALFELLCVGLSIMNLKLFDAYRIINSRILVMTLEYLGNIRVG